jgi:hypothetical protein
VRSLVASVALLSLTLAANASARAASAGSASWWQRIEAALDKAAEPHKIVPPTPVVVHWQPREIWSGELSGDLVDMIGVDLYGKGKSDLVALTSDKLVVLSMQRGLFDVRMQAELPAKLAPIRSRDAMGTLTLVRADDASISLRARSSERALGGVYKLVDNTMSQVDEFRGYSLCHKSTILAAPGRNYFLSSRITWNTEEQVAGDASNFALRDFADSLYSLRCTDALVDPTGHPAEYLSAVSSDGELRVYCKGKAAHCQGQEPIISEVGDAHLVTDVDNDGLPEVVHATRSAPGASDRVLVTRSGPKGTTIQYQKDFDGGVVAIASGDFAGHGAREIIVAIRQGKSKRVTLWLLN